MFWSEWMRPVVVVALLGSACSDDGVGVATGSTGDGTDDGSMSTTGGVTSLMTTTAGESSEPSGGSSGGLGDTSSGGGDSTSGTTEDSTGSGSTSTGGEESGSTTTGGASGNECMSDADCVRIEDCCTCAAQHVDEPVPQCGIQACLVTACFGEGLAGHDVECRFGSCEFVPVDCNAREVTCKDRPPDCPAGDLPTVVNGCWGPCIAAEVCDVVPDCDHCPDDEICVATATQIGFLYSCEPLDPSCGVGATCDCMGEVCEPPYDLCVEAGAADLDCQCRDC